MSTLPLRGDGVFPFLRDIVGIFPQDAETFHDGRERNVLLGGQFGTFAHRQQDRSGVRLEARDGFGLTGLANDVDGLVKWKMKNVNSTSSGCAILQRYLPYRRALGPDMG